MLDHDKYFAESLIKILTDTAKIEPHYTNLNEKVYTNDLEHHVM